MLTLVETWQCKAEFEQLSSPDTILWCAYLKQRELIGRELCPDDANKHAQSPVQQDPFSA